MNGRISRVGANLEYAGKEGKGEMKKIAVCGKGGSGKSVIVSLLAKGLHKKGYRVLVVDSDESNMELYRMLGLSHSPDPLINLVGGKAGVKEGMKVKGSGYQAGVMSREEIMVADIPAQYLVQENGVRLVSIGKILQFLEGCACPMGVLSREFLKRLRLKDDEVAIIDMEAGLEHFGRGVEEGVDTLLMVVEPSFESLKLAARIKSIAAEAGMERVWVVLNKIPSPDVDAALKSKLQESGLIVIGAVGYDAEIALSSLEGVSVGGSKAEKDIEKVLERMLQP